MLGFSIYDVTGKPDSGLRRNKENYSATLILACWKQYLDWNSK